MKELILVILTALGTKLVDWLFSRRHNRAVVMEAEIANLRTIITTWQDNAEKWEKQAAEYQKEIIEWQKQAMAYRKELNEATAIINSLKVDIIKLRAELAQVRQNTDTQC